MLKERDKKPGIIIPAETLLAINECFTCTLVKLPVFDLCKQQQLIVFNSHNSHGLETNKYLRTINFCEPLH